MAMFLWSRWRHDMVALGALLACVLAGLLPSREAFLGFGHPAVITVACVLVLSKGLENSGAASSRNRPPEQHAHSRAGRIPLRRLLATGPAAGDPGPYRDDPHAPDRLAAVTFLRCGSRSDGCGKEKRVDSGTLLAYYGCDPRLLPDHSIRTPGAAGRPMDERGANIGRKRPLNKRRGRNGK